MNCPNCGREMQKGTLRSRGGNFFLPEGEKAPLVYTKKMLRRRNALPLPPDPYTLDFNVAEWPEGYACRECRQIILSYDE